MHHNDRVSFGSRLGAILAAAGSAVGLGNIGASHMKQETMGELSLF